MKVKALQLTNFRNHQDTTIEFCDGVNLITGQNAQGKTSILEALSYVCLTKSFLQQSERTIVKHGTDSFSVDAAIVKEPGIRHEARVVFETGIGKKYYLNGGDARRASDIVGMFPIVVLHPGDFSLTGGGPSERRKFLDMLLSQVSRSYLEELIEFGRAVKQRNKILLDGKLTGGLDPGILDAWTDALVLHGTRIVSRRATFLHEFQDVFASAYASLVDIGETPAISYTPSFAFDSDISGSFYDNLRRLSNVERARGSTLTGPHRDDIEFTLNGFPVKEYASQGQNKTILVALKMAEFSYMKTMLAETPVVLLDDVMSELDSCRSRNTLKAIAYLGQTFITGTDLVDVFDANSQDASRYFALEPKIHFVKEGSILYQHV